MIKIKKRTLRKIERKINLFIFKIFKRILQPFSRYFRRVFEFGKIQRVFSAFVVISAFSFAVVPNSVSDVQTIIDKNTSQVVQAQIQTNTEKSIRLPLESYSLSQGYNFIHQGIDMAVKLNSNVYPIMDGVVEKAQRDRWAYGNYVLINHGSGLHSLYAHLSKINVKENQAVTKEEILGLVGSTGWSTGPHLHLQIWEQNKWVNPKTFFESYFGKRLASSK